MVSTEYKKLALRQKQSLPLEGKIILTQKRIQDWYDHYDGQVYVSFSGGKDSTVLLDIVRNTPGVYDVPAVFVNTGLEYPEIQQFVRQQENVTILRPEMRFDEVIKKYGYPLISKKVANTVSGAKPGNVRHQMLKGEFKNPQTGEPSRFNCQKWAFMLDVPFKVSDMCCNVMKKAPAKKYEKETGRKPILGLMAAESSERKKSYLQTGCNAYDKKSPQSQPMAFWTEQDVLEYLYTKKIPYASVYGEIKQADDGTYYTTGANRTGCIFCGFGCHLEKDGEKRFVNLKTTHPKQYDFCIKGGCIDENGMIQPGNGGLGLGMVFDAVKTATDGKIDIEY